MYKDNKNILLISGNNYFNAKQQTVILLLKTLVFTVGQLGDVHGEIMILISSIGQN